ncbi:Protein DEHYDRATION-INDUCED 19 homolog 3, partial [Striga hermonthica]
EGNYALIGKNYRNAIKALFCGLKLGKISSHRSEVVMQRSKVSDSSVQK